MNIDDLLSPYRGFNGRTSVADDSTDRGRATALGVQRATRIDRGPELPSPESWEMFEFVQALTA